MGGDSSTMVQISGDVIHVVEHESFSSTAFSNHITSNISHVVAARHVMQAIRDGEAVDMIRMHDLKQSMHHRMQYQS